MSLNGAATADAAANWQTGVGYRWPELQVPAAGKTGFTLLPPETTGISFTISLPINDQSATRIC